MADFYTDGQKRQIQLTAFEILKLFDGICRRNDLKYYLTAGSLLGAVRHGGFIPWDDDVDVAMPREDFDKLLKIAAEELPAGYFYQDSRTDKKYPFLFSKIRKDGDEVYEKILDGVDIHKGRYIDIFPLDKCPDNPSVARKYFKKIEFLKMAMLEKGSDKFTSGYTRFIPKLVLALFKRLPWGTLRFIRNATVKYYAARSSGKWLCTVAGTHGYPKETYDCEWFIGEREMTFEGVSFFVPKESERLLQSMYGDYMTPPDESLRGGHFTNPESN